MTAVGLLGINAGLLARFTYTSGDSVEPPSFSTVVSLSRCRTHREVGDCVPDPQSVLVFLAGPLRASFSSLALIPVVQIKGGGIARKSSNYHVQNILRINYI